MWQSRQGAQSFTQQAFTQSSQTSANARNPTQKGKKTSDGGKNKDKILFLIFSFYEVIEFDLYAIPCDHKNEYLDSVRIRKFWLVLLCFLLLFFLQEISYMDYRSVYLMIPLWIFLFFF